MRNSGVRSVRTWIANGSTTGYNIAFVAVVFTSTDNTWYILGEKFHPNGVILASGYTNQLSYTFSWSKNPVYITLGHQLGGPTSDVQDTGYDWVRVRKYASAEPTTSLGAEQTP